MPPSCRGSSFGENGAGMKISLSCSSTNSRMFGGQPSIFCEPEPPASYRWSASPDGSLTITPIGHSCADRDTAVVGTWHRS